MGSEIRKIAGCACAGMPGTFSRHRLQRKPLVSYPSMHHGTCVTHVPWSMSGLLTRVGVENVPFIPGILSKRPIIWTSDDPIFWHIYATIGLYELTVCRMIYFSTLDFNTCYLMFSEQCQFISKTNSTLRLIYINWLRQTMSILLANWKKPTHNNNELYSLCACMLCRLMTKLCN